jgi:hypothetical protein
MKTKEELKEFFPKNKTSSVEFQEWILDQIKIGNFEHELIEIDNCLVSKDALKIYSVRVNVTAKTQKIIAEFLGLNMIDQKLFDKRFLNSNMQLPEILPISDSVEQMINSSIKIDENYFTAKNKASNIISCSKTWINYNNNKSTNYGFLIKTNNNYYRGIRLSKTTIPGILCIQPPSTFHNELHTDYSQHALFYKKIKIKSHLIYKK